jgi:hypothetical protein
MASITFTEAFMRRLLLAAFSLLFAASLALPLHAQGAPTQTAAGQPYTIEYYYKCQWGHQQEFLRALPQEPLPSAQEDPGDGSHSLP